MKTGLFSTMWSENGSGKMKWAIINHTKGQSVPNEGYSVYHGIGKALCITSSFHKIKWHIQTRTVLYQIKLKAAILWKVSRTGSLKSFQITSLGKLSRNLYTLAEMPDLPDLPDLEPFELVRISIPTKFSWEEFQFSGSL